jgi:type II secretory pathway pseudopilin PulG
MTLVELVVVVAILATVAGAVTIAVVSTLKKEQSKACLANMLIIEAAKDEYARDHPGATQVDDPTEFVKYFRTRLVRQRSLMSKSSARLKLQLTSNFGKYWRTLPVALTPGQPIINGKSHKKTEQPLLVGLPP